MESNIQYDQNNAEDEGVGLVTAAQLTRRQGFYFQQATIKPIPISHHGRVSHVLISLEQYQSLSRSEIKPELGESRRLLRSVVDYMGQGFMWLDANMNILMMNAQAAAHFEVDPDLIVGSNLVSIIPQLHETLFYSRVQRTQAFGEFHSADVPSLVRPRMIIHFETFPVDGGVGVTMRPIDDDAPDGRRPGVRDSILLALREHGTVGYVQLNLRGMIEHADHVFSEFVMLDASRLQSIAFIDLASRQCRVTVRDAIDHVMSTDTTVRLEVELLANDGSILSLIAVITPIKRQFGMAGAVVVLSRPAVPI